MPDRSEVPVPEEAMGAFRRGFGWTGAPLSDERLRNALQAAAPFIAAKAVDVAEKQAARARNAEIERNEAEHELNLLREIVGGNADKLGELSKDRSELVQGLARVMDERDQAAEKERERLREALTGLHNGPGPDRDERYQDAWRHGVADAADRITALDGSEDGNA